MVFFLSRSLTSLETRKNRHSLSSGQRLPKFLSWQNHSSANKQTQKLYIHNPECERFNINSLISLTRSYGNLGETSRVKALHWQMIVRGLDPVKTGFIGNKLLTAYTKCRCLDSARHLFEKLQNPSPSAHVSMITAYAVHGRIQKACRVFEEMSYRSSVSWNAMISGHIKRGREKEAIRLFQRMLAEGVRPSHFTFSIVLVAVPRLGLGFVDHGLLVHGQIVKSGLGSFVVVANGLINMYSKFQRMEDAGQVFEEMRVKDVASWTTMVSGYSRIDNMQIAEWFFERMGKRNVVSWNAMIAAFAKSGDVGKALGFFKRMEREGNVPNVSTFLSVVKSVTSDRDLVFGEVVHGRVLKMGYGENVFVGSALIDMYFKCKDASGAQNVFDEIRENNLVSWSVLVNGYAKEGKMDVAESLFWKMPERNVVSWNAMISGNAQIGEYVAALGFFVKMQHKDVLSDEFTFSSVLNACAGLGFLDVGRHIHGKSVVAGLDSDVSVGNALIAMYSKQGKLDDAFQIFLSLPQLDVVSWTTMVTACAENGRIDDARHLFDKMPARNSVSWNAMITGYLQNRRREEAYRLFKNMPNPNLATWNAMITVCSCEESFDFFFQMHREGIQPDQSTFTGVLGICSELGVLEKGKQVHAYVIKQNFGSDVPVSNSLITMYGKCGNIHDSCQILNKMVVRDVVSWNAMITVHAQHGNSYEAIRLFEEMKLSGMKPNHITFIGVLSACCHASLVNKGWFFFHSMKNDYKIPLQSDHFACMVDLLGRAGHIEKAVELIRSMPFSPDIVIWGTLLGACHLHANLEFGNLAAQKVIELDPQNAAAFVSLSNIYAMFGRWDEVSKLRTLMKERQIKKIPACSWIEINHQVHRFVASDTSHTQSEKIYSLLETLSKQMKLAGYMPNTRCFESCE